jgi:hypothetical protein
MMDWAQFAIAAAQHAEVELAYFAALPVSALYRVETTVYHSD